MQSWRYKPNEIADQYALFSQGDEYQSTFTFPADVMAVLRAKRHLVLIQRQFLIVRWQKLLKLAQSLFKRFKLSSDHRLVRISITMWMRSSAELFTTSCTCLLSNHQTSPVAMWTCSSPATKLQPGADCRTI